MKTGKDPRHLRRIRIMQHLFANSFPKGQADPTISHIAQQLETIDRHIETSAPEWPIAKIARIDLAILRLAIFELLQKKEPHKVIIDEAVELAKEFGNDNSPKFVNGALGTIVKKI